MSSYLVLNRHVAHGTFLVACVLVALGPTGANAQPPLPPPEISKPWHKAGAYIYHKWRTELTFTFTDSPTAKFSTLPPPLALFTLELPAHDLTADDFKDLAVVTTLQKLSLRYRSSSSSDKDSGVDLKGLCELTDLPALELSQMNLSEKAYAELAKLNKLRELHIGYCRLTDDSLTHVGKLSELEVFDASCDSKGTENVTAAGVKALAAAPKLSKVKFYQFPLDDEGCKHLGRMKNLQTLYVHDGDVTVSDEGCKHLAGATKLSDLSINVWNSRITDEGIKHLVGMKELTKLHLRHSEVTDKGCEHLAKLKNLRSLDLSDTAITNAGLEHLRGLKNLESLDLRGNSSLTSGGLKPLHDLKNLKSLQIRGTKMYGTPARKKLLDELRAALPECEIITEAQYGDP